MASAAVSRPRAFPVPPVIAGKHHVQATLNYFKPLKEGQEPPTIYPFRPEKHHEIQAWTEPVSMTIYDIAGEELNYNLDQNGFQFYYHKTNASDFTSPEAIEREYLPEMEQMLKDVTGAKFVYVFNPIVRRPGTDPTKTAQGPVPLVHVDLTPQEAIHGARAELGSRVDDLVKGRFQVIQAWRPLKPILKDPFAVADATSVPEDDLIHTKVEFPKREGSTFNVTKGPSHRWYYRYGQTPDIVTLFKGYDSKTGIARRTPHSAFTDPDTVDNAPRESVEVRAYIFHEP